MATLEELRERYKAQALKRKKEDALPEPKSLPNQLDVNEIASERAKHKKRKKRQMGKYLGQNGEGKDRRGLVDWGAIKGKVIFKFKPKPDVLFLFGGKKKHHLSEIYDEKYLRWLIHDLKLESPDNALFHKLVQERLIELEY